MRGTILFEVISTLMQVLANTMGDLRIKGSGVFFDIDKFRGPDGMTREYFGPYSWRFEKTDETSGPDRYFVGFSFKSILLVYGK